jgi:RNA polymerase sigma factor (sigma-70 family)
MIAASDFGPGPDGELDVAQVLAEARSGHPDALADLVRRYTPALWNVARQQGLDRASSEDVVQTAWLRLVRSPSSIRTPQALLSWLITLTRREAWRVAGQSRLEHVSDDVGALAAPEAAPTPEQDLIAREEETALWEAVHQLEPRCQELLRVVAFVHRPDYHAVARALGMPVGSVGPTRGRCLAKLRALLAATAQWSES